MNPLIGDGDAFTKFVVFLEQLDNHQPFPSSDGVLAWCLLARRGSGKNVVLLFSSGLTVLDSEQWLVINSSLMANLQSDRICGRIFIKLPPN